MEALILETKTTYFLIRQEIDEFGGIWETKIELTKADYHAFNNWMMSQQQGSWRRTARRINQEKEIL